MLDKGQATRIEYLIGKVVSAHTIEYPEFMRLWTPNIAN